ncbi:PLP-dependent aminotransferase family protein [Algicella marina]|uniref:Aminotransferase class I/II-fold pyridoxal phosphate-dependent enzyme n=1 Tax=Algicella marina TaxID=2683284 RepID=A0A6P1SW55_9RHOB|nr:PLP-dependent aminotransferase family protein [Algicella marina]QHQ34904.1 aminotransferase class I/II-fold pyridoxal phosphate-dependent enzyme [Algicella marina]
MRISETQFFLDREAGIGLQVQLRERIAAAILARRFTPGQRLPSSRKLADHLGIARITVSIVYQDLVADGYLEAAPRSGFFVADDAPDLLPANTRPKVPAEERLDWDGWLTGRYRRLLRVEKPLDWRAYPYPFIYGQIDPDLFPHDDWRDCARRALGKRDFAQVAADAIHSDDPKLVAHILSHGLPARGVTAAAEEVLVTLGAQNALWLVIQLLSANRPRLRVVIEDPGYPELREALRLSGCEIVPVAVDADGLPPQAIPEGVDLVCVSPSHQAPTGVTMPMARRKELMALAEERNFLILEDDYDFEMSFLKPANPALKSFDRRGRVIHVGSFSKSLFPGLRLGYLHADARFIEEARSLRALIMRHPPGTPQRTTAHFLALGHYNAHVRRLREAFRKRRAVMTDALQTHGLRVAAASGFGGAGFWIAGPPGLDSIEFARDLREDGVLIEPGTTFFAGAHPPTHFFRMAYSSISHKKIPEGIARLARRL